MSDERILNELSPPARGWQRLLARRDAAPQPQGWRLPLATAAALALVVFLIRPKPAVLQLPWESGWLVGQASEGAGLQQVNGKQATALPSDDPQVRFYWLQDTGE
jgi:hypothetical protein